MPYVFGAIRIVDLFLENEVFHVIKRLLEEEIIYGVQVLPQHPLQPKPEVSHLITDEMLPGLLGKLDCPAIVHSPHEYGGGVNLSQVGDLEGIHTRYGQTQGLTRSQWNALGLRRARKVAEITQRQPNWPGIIIHPGAGLQELDIEANETVVVSLQEQLSDWQVGIEINPIKIKGQESPNTFDPGWPQDKLFSIGGTPESMSKLLHRLPQNHCLFFDFTHLLTLASQLERETNELIKEYLALRHWPVCHFSGNPNAPVHDHPGFLRDKPYSAEVHAALAGMEVIILETGWSNFEKASQEVTAFRRQYPL